MEDKPVKEDKHGELADNLFKVYYNIWGGKQLKRTVCNIELPNFFQRVPQDHELLPQKLREEARAILLERKSREVLDNDELQDFWFLLEKHFSPPVINGEKYLTYENFKAVAKEAPEKARPYFTAATFAKLTRNDDPLSRVSLLTFFNYIMKSVWLQQTRIGISLYDVSGEGYLREMDLENYIMELIPSLRQLSSIEPSFQTFYVCTAVRKFFFFLDPLRAGRIRITDILASGFLDSMLELREQHTSAVQLENNWFSHQCAMRVYGSYLQLDEDRNGMLTRDELSNFGNGTLTTTFLDRVFQECVTYEGEMDYKAYLDFVLAMENKNEPQALGYLFRILDLGGRGRLTGLTLRYFYDGIAERLGDCGHTPPTFMDMQNEIFDMVQPANPGYITLDDLVKCGKGETIINILIDLHGFWSHENREMLLVDIPDEAEL